ncbi:MAG: FecR domain-containing protein [Sedimentisphaerales bacterium]|nr:FecR domain-containing protein [Sedimentisphaerales bacterium]
MTSNYPTPEMEMVALLGQMRDRQISPEQVNRLEELLKHSPSRQLYLIDYASLCTDLETMFKGRDKGEFETNIDNNAMGNDDSDILREIIAHDIEEMAHRDQAFSKMDIEKIKQIAEQRLRESLNEISPAKAKAYTDAGRLSFLRDYVGYQRQRFARPLKMLAACLLISLIGYFIYDRFFETSPRLRYAINTYVVRGERTLPAADIHKLKAGDMVKIGSGGNAVIQYRTEKTSLQLDENTHFAVLSQEKGKQFKLTQGKVDALVAPQPANQPLIIDSEHGRSRVLGTSFQLTANPLGACLAVRTGRVQLTRRDDGRSIDVDAGYYALAAGSVEFEAKPYSDGMDLSRNFWRIKPYATGSRSIAMEAIAAPQYANVEYYFECISGDGHDSGWRASPFYEDQNLQPDTEYAYRLKVREALGNYAGSALSFSAMARTTEAVTVEAETGELTGIFQIGEDELASGGRYISSGTPNTKGNTRKQFSDADNNKASYQVNLEKAGLYRIRGWCFTPRIDSNSRNNSFYVVIDGNTKNYYTWQTVLSNTEYSPDYINNFDKVDEDKIIDPVEIYLEKGPHTIEFYVREEQSRLDRFEFEYQPNQ